jgi:hypothetical protein
MVIVYIIGIIILMGLFGVFVGGNMVGYHRYFRGKKLVGVVFVIGTWVAFVPLFYEIVSGFVGQIPKPSEGFLGIALCFAAAGVWLVGPHINKFLLSE